MVKHVHVTKWHRGTRLYWSRVNVFGRCPGTCWHVYGSRVRRSGTDAWAGSRQKSSSSPVSLEPPKRRCFAKFDGNGSKRWDGKEIEVQGEWLESLYSPEELAPGNRLNLITMPWKGEEYNTLERGCRWSKRRKEKRKRNKGRKPLAGLPIENKRKLNPKKRLESEPPLLSLSMLVYIVCSITHFHSKHVLLHLYSMHNVACIQWYCLLVVAEKGKTEKEKGKIIRIENSSESCTPTETGWW